MTALEGAVEPTAEEREELAQQAHDLDMTIRGGLIKGRRALWEVAQALFGFDEMLGWQWLDYENKSEWLADPQISMTSTTYYRLVGVWRELVIVRKVDPDQLADLDISKVSIVLPKLQMGKVKQKEALNDAEALGARDLREKYMARPKITAPPEAEEEEDEQIIDVEVEPAAPSEEMWDEIVGRAKRQRQNLVKFIAQKTDWERYGDGDGTEREDWALPEIVGDAEGLDEAEAGDSSLEDAQALRTPQNGSGDRGKIDKAILRQAKKDWEALRAELVAACESGQAHPRIDVHLIRVGVQGANLLIERVDDEWSSG